MSKSLYLINPRNALPSYFGAEVFEAYGFRPAVAMADLATTTVAALAPKDWRVSICEEHVSPVDFDVDADFIGLTGKVTQVPRMLAIAAEFRRRGKTVIAGGSFASLNPAALRPHVDILVTGELESIAQGFFADLERGSWKAEYAGGKPELSASPVPRWDLYPNERAVMGCVQTSRGCPFECDFCDVIVYLGRQQRHKPVAAILAELELLYGLGYRTVFFADDNFTVYRRRARELLTAVRDWNRARPDGAMAFATQVSIDAARDPELVRLCAEAGVEFVFIGLETPNAESLAECGKVQNLNVDLPEQVRVFLANGIAVSAGMIVGFDHDGPDIFRRQLEFAAVSRVPVFSLGALVAPFATPLYERLSALGRIEDGPPEVVASPWDTNIVGSKLGKEELIGGLRRLCNSLYSPENFGRRVLDMIEALGPHPLLTREQAKRSSRGVDSDTLLTVRRLSRLGPAEAAMVRSVFAAMGRRPHASRAAMTALFRYAQVRRMYDTGGFWDPMLAQEDKPALEPALAA